MRMPRCIIVDPGARAFFIYDENNKRVAIFPWGAGIEDRAYHEAAADAVQFLTAYSATVCENSEAKREEICLREYIKRERMRNIRAEEQMREELKP